MFTKVSQDNGKYRYKSKECKINKNFCSYLFSKNIKYKLYDVTFFQIFIITFLTNVTNINVLFFLHYMLNIFQSSYFTLPIILS